MPIQLTRELRAAIRSAITAQSTWPQWRARHLQNPDGTLRDSSTMTRAEILQAAQDLAVDVSAVAARFGQAATLDDIATAPALTDTDTDESPNESTDTDEPVPAAPHHTYEGRDPKALIQEALGSASDFLSAKVLETITSGLMPIASAAVAPPQVITREVVRTVNVRAQGEGADTLARPCNIVKTGSGRDVLGIRASECGTWRSVLEQPVSVWDGTGQEGVPEVDPHHIWDAEALAYMTIASRYADEGHKLRHMSRVLFYGPAGTGKTSTAEQFAARTGRPFVRIAFDRNTEAQDLIGQRLPKSGGGTEFRDGALVAAMQIPGCVILTDEPSFVRPGVAAVLQTILDKGCVYLKEDGNRRVDLAPGVVIIAADNTNLTGDESGRYADTLTQNVALQDRFAWLVAMDYLPESREAAVLVNRTGIPLDAARAMVTFATTTRKGAATGQLTTGCSLRRLIAWAVGVKAGVPSASAFRAAIINAADATDRETVRGLEKNCAPHDAIDASVSGKPLPVDPMQGQTSTAQGATAASRFDNV